MQSKNKLNSPITFLIIIIILCVLGGLIIYHSTTWGPWAFSDSSSYVSAAKNFSAGNGFVIVNANGGITHVTEFPPFYPVFLSFFLGSDGDPVVVLRWVNIFLFMAFIAILGCFLYYMTKNTILAALGTLICLSAPTIVEIFVGVMSETLFLPLLLSILYLANIYIRKKETHIYMLLVVMSALLPITRYAGALFIAVITLLILVFLEEDFITRLKKAGLYVVTSILPLGLWFSKLYLQFNKVGGKRFNFSLDIFKSLFNSIQSEFNVLKNWLPYYGIYNNPTINQILSIGSLVILVTLFILFLLNNHKKENELINHLFIFSALSLTAYILFIAFTHSITIPQIDIIDRMMVPLYPLMTGMMISGLSYLFTKERRWFTILTIAALLVAIRFNLLTSSVFINEMHQNGRGFSAREYHEAGILVKLDNLPDDQKLISNSSAFVLYHINRFPLQINQFTNMTYGDHNGYGEKTFREKGAALIIIYPHFMNYYGDSAEQLLSNATNGLTIDYQDDVSGIYSYPLSGPTQP